MAKRRIIIELDSDFAGFGKPPLIHEGGMYRQYSSISATDLTQPEITVHYHMSEDSAELATFVEEIVERLKENNNVRPSLKA